MLYEPTLLRYLPFEMQPKTWDIVMCLKAVVWVTLPLDQHDMPTYQFMKSSVASKLSVLRLLLEGAIVCRLTFPDIAFFAGGDKKRRLDDAAEYSSGWVSSSFGGDR